jgi:TetR/AcrR family transcriptional regulator
LPPITAPVNSRQTEYWWFGGCSKSAGDPKMVSDRTQEPVLAGKAVVPGKRGRAPLRKEQQRTIETREKIIEAAVCEFAAHGYEGASVREMARKAEVQHTQITYHFTDKAGLWQAMIEKLATSFVSRQTDRKEGLRGVDETVQLRLLMEDFIRYSAIDLDFHKIMLHASTGRIQLDSLVNDVIRPYFTMMAELIVAVQNKGEFVPGDPIHLHYLFIGATSRLFMQATEAEMIIGKRVDDPAFIDQHVSTLLSLFFREPTEN